MHIFDTKTARAILTVLAFALVLGFLWAARRTLLLFLFAMLFAYLLEPLISRAQRSLKGRRALAIAAVYLGIVVALGIFGVSAGPRIADEGAKLGRSLPDLYQKITTGNIAWQLGARRGWSVETTQQIQHFLAAHQGSVQLFASNIASHVGEIATNIGWVVLVPILAVFFLKDKRDFRAAIEQAITNGRVRDFVHVVLGDLDQMLAHFVRAQLMLAVISGSVYTIGLTVLRVPYSYVLGVVGGLLEFVPVVGPLMAAVLILGIAFASNYSHIFLLLLLLGGWRILQDYVVAPRIYGGKVELHPLAAIFGVLTGGEIAGVVGVYLAIPVMGTVRILWRRWRMLSKEAREGPVAVPERAA